MLAFDIEGRRVLDLFAGSGQMGLEALSRGAVSAVMVDSSRAAAEVIRRNASKTGLDGAEVVCCDSVKWLSDAARQGLSYDIVFMDPPYAAGLIPSCLWGLVRGGLLKKSSVIVCESGSNEGVFGGDAELEGRFDVIKSTRYGVAFVNILKLRCNENDE